MSSRKKPRLYPLGIVEERLDFKASAEGSCRKHVNPAYPECGSLDSKNRAGNAFQCQHCGYGDDAEGLAAHNLKARLSDPDISLYTPKERVRAVLLDRFNARLREAKSDQRRSVSGRTPGTKRKPSQPKGETTGTIQQNRCEKLSTTVHISGNR